MKGKKFLCVFLSCIMLLVMAACGSSGQANTSSTDTADTPKASTVEAASGGDMKKLQFWNFYPGKEMEFFERCVAQFNEETEGVQMEYVHMSEEDYRGTKMATAFASGTGPDVFMVYPGSFLRYADTGVLAPLNDAISADVLADFAKSSIDAVTVDGKILAIPFEIELLGLYYDKDVLSSAGVEPPKTWSELHQVASAVKTDTMAGFTMDVPKGGHQLFEWYPFLWQAGANIYNADETAADINRPGVIENLQLRRDMFADFTSNIRPSRSGGDIGIIGDGETAMQLCGSWAITKLEQDYPDRNIGVVPLPIPAGGTAATVAGGWKLVANGMSPNAKEAMDFAIWMYAGDDISRMTEWCTELKFAYPPRASVVESVQSLYTEGLREVFTNQIYGTERSEMRLPPDVATILEDMLQTCYFDTSVSVETAVANAEKQINDFLASYQGAL